jgi:hypothetical protein
VHAVRIEPLGVGVRTGVCIAVIPSLGKRQRRRVSLLGSVAVIRQPAFDLE